MKLLDRANGNIVRTEEEKAQMIVEGAKWYGKFLLALGYDYTKDENSADTPRRYAKSFVEDLVAGSMEQEPKITSFPNDEGYEGMVAQTNIEVRSMCSHHHREVVGKAHVAYIPGSRGRMIGLSKFNRIVSFFSQRLQLQEGLTKQIHDYVNDKCKGNKGVAVIITADHGCVKCRGVRMASTMATAQMTGYFFKNEVGSKDELYKLIELSSK